MIFGKSASNQTRNPTEEVINTQLNVYNKQVVQLSEFIPVTAPPSWTSYGGITGDYFVNGSQITGASTVEMYYDYTSGFTGPLLLRITGLPYLSLDPVDNSFYHPAISNVIPFNYASDYYQYTVRNNSMVVINPTNSAGWYLDPESGTLTFFETPNTTSINPSNPPIVDVIIYNGPMGFGSGNGVISAPAGSTGWIYWTDGVTGLWRPEFPLDQYLEKSFVGVTTISIDHGWGQKPYVNIIDRNYNRILFFDMIYNDDNNFTVNFDHPKDGIVIAQGKIGSIFSEGQITQTFTTATSVTIYHNWDKNPEVDVYDVSGNEIAVFDQQFYTTDSVTINFDSPQSGSIVLTGSSWPSAPQYDEWPFSSVTGITIPHNYGKVPAVTLLDTSNNKILIYNTQVIDNDNIYLSFFDSQTGTVITQGTFGAKDPHIDRAGRLWEAGTNYSIKNRGANISTGERSLAVGFGNIVSGDQSAVFGNNNEILSDRSFVAGGLGITATQDDTLYAPRFSFLQGITIPSPVSSVDSSGITGELFFDTDYLYIKTTDPSYPWKRLALNTF